MKRCAARILLAFLTFAIGTGAAFVCKRWFAQPAAKTVSAGSEIELKLPEPVVAPAPEKIKKPVVTLISPYEIKQLVDENRIQGNVENVLDLRPIFKQLGMDVEDTEASMTDCKGNCEATVFTLEHANEPGEEILLRLTDSTGYYLHLIFKHPNTKYSNGADWKFYGFIDLWSWWYSPLERPQVANIGGEHYLRLKNISGHGSGYGRGDESWYEISESGVEKVLSYQTGIYAYPEWTSPGLKSTAKVLNVGCADGVTTIILQFSNSYEAWRNPDEKIFQLFTAKRQVAFVKPLGASKFIFDPSRSEIPAEEFENLYDYGDGYDWTGFLKYNYPELARIAAGRDAKRKEWLKDFLDEFADSPQKKTLQEALERNQP